MGRFAAAPEWEGESVNFFVQDDQGGRLEEVFCQPATREDLKDLSDELQLMGERLEAIRPNAPSEETLQRILLRTVRELTDDPLRTDLDNYFFRYRDANGHGRLVWCWGYQRTDQEAAPAVICTDPDCNLLFLRRPDEAQMPQLPGGTAGRAPPAVALETQCAAGIAAVADRRRTVLVSAAQARCCRSSGGKTGGRRTPRIRRLPCRKWRRLLPRRDDNLPLPPGNPVAVKVLSDQGPAVAFAVGTQFDDFRVVAEYPNGVTRLVTKRATIRTSQPADQAPLTASGGRLLGVRPGQTVVQAEFDGVRSQQGLPVTVLADAGKGAVSSLHETLHGDTGFQLVPRDSRLAGASIVIGQRVGDFQIDPTPIVITPGDRIVYQVTGTQNGQVRMLGPDEGVRLSVDDSRVAEVTSGLTVQALGEGHTLVTARRGEQEATASLTVSTTDREAVEYHRHGYRLRHIGDRDVVIYSGSDGVVSSTVTESPSVSESVGIRPDRIWIEPGDFTLQRDAVSPSLRVMAAVGSEKPQEVPATLESLDHNVLVADATQPGRFQAAGYGGTQVRATYRDREAFANVTVTGARFLSVNSKLHEGANDFSVDIDVRAASDEGAVEYRVYRSGEKPPDNWVPSQAADGYRSTTLHSPVIPYGQHNARYNLTIKAQ